MADDEHRSLIIGEIGFQPGDGIHIQVVGGLVQQEKVRLGQQQPAQSGPGFLASGEGGEGLGKFFFPEPQSLQNPCHLALAGVPVFHLKSVGQPGIGFHKCIQLFFGSRFHLLFQKPHFLLHIQNVLFGGKNGFINCLVSGNILLLSKVTQGLSPGQDHLTGIRSQLPDYHLQQCGFSGSVDADKSRFLVFFYMEAGLPDYLRGHKRLFQILTRKYHATYLPKICPSESAVKPRHKLNTNRKKENRQEKPKKSLTIL